MWPVLRTLVGIGGALLLLGGLAALVARFETITALQMIILGGLGVIIAVLERARYTAADGGSPQLRRTEEVFVDPTTGQRTRVWIDPASGERVYRPE
jgi:hypothetical protein